jgi:hypothetical protein
MKMKPSNYNNSQKDSKCEKKWEERKSQSSSSSEEKQEKCKQQKVIMITQSGEINGTLTS